MATPISSTIPVTAVGVLQPQKSDEDILTLADNAGKGGILDKAALDDIKSLHPKVPNSMALRYLKQVCYKYGEKNNMFDRHHVDSELQNTMAENGDVQLTPEHDAAYLEKKLVKYAHTWRAIGTALNFQSHDLNNIEANALMTGGSVEKCLIRLVEDWLQQKHEHTLPPTKNSLQEALRSEMVGLGDVACGLAFSNASYATPQDCPYCIIDVSEDLKSSRVSTKSLQTAENKSVLLEIRYDHNKRHAATYQWFQNGLELEDEKQSILYIYGDINMDGCEFTCKITTNSHSFTTPITLNVSCPLDKYSQSLASMYLAMPEVPEDKWPPQSSKKYINLALIKQEVKLNYRNKYVRETIRNDLDDVLQHKERIEYDAVLNTLKCGQVLFVEGRPGCGKTTFVHKITQDWAWAWARARARAITHHGRGSIRLMLLVSLRVLNLLYLQKPNLDLTDILKLFHRLQVSKKALEKREGRGVCFIFDGLDEFSPHDGNNSIVFKIIKKSYLSESTVIIASRPAAIAKWRGYADVIEVLGFLEEQILEYFDSYHFSKELKTYLLSHPNILHMCYLPIHSAIVAYLYELTGEIPRTETEIYTHFMHSTIRRSLSKNADMDEEINVTNLSGNEKRLFNQICELALIKTVENKQFLQQDEVSESFVNQTGGDISLGLITIDRVAIIRASTLFFISPSKNI